MIIAELETVLAARGLTAVREEYTTKEWYAIQGWPRPGRKQGDTPIVVLRVKNPLHGKDLCFDFHESKGDLVLWNMYFGGYDYEWFNYRPPVAEEIDRVLGDGITVIRWSKVRAVPHGICSAYWISDDPEEDDSLELAEAVARLRKKAAKGAWLFGKEGRFEVYSWNTYECIAPEKRKK
jgi:hypothetical protein